MAFHHTIFLFSILCFSKFQLDAKEGFSSEASDMLGLVLSRWNQRILIL
ncbi:hypothetical protein LEP1GSC202_3774 [Leptospira yanagawae serovar Saopaulo str. Sao Paulo = ATCC 700523]|uniref:Uncharacterized protein n=1 Tax=Leptospira yanagawae serovar Saopaulo str. Sao Paulo = ATCC 700523 TaxID=1249483 RepID=A0A5E8HHF0_9LEPT|nr:hypothetical protein LEP1GSC202_3774 [Leptospira yanagawae serovar Saopaulo str. Sao Paulo = ATCC 700523]